MHWWDPIPYVGRANVAARLYEKSHYRKNQVWRVR